MTTALLGFGAAFVVPAAQAADGTLLLNETFEGSEVLDSRAIGLNDACLTGAALDSLPPAGVSNLSDCQGHLNGTPTPGGIPGWLQLTDNWFNSTGGMAFDRALPSSAGVVVEFDQAQYGNSGADGIGFFLSDGSRTLTSTGGFGGSLGYGQKEQNGVDTPGVAGGYLGVGLDTFGNFVGDFDSLGRGCAVVSPFENRVGNTVTLRGPGDGMTGYCFLASTAVVGGGNTLPGELRSTTGLADAVRNIRVTVSPGDFPTVTVEIDFTGTKASYQTVLTHVMTDRAPATYKFGFSGSTGDLRDVHLIRGVTITSVNALGDISLVKQVDNTTPQPDVYGVGDTVPYQFVVTNTSAATITDIVVTDPLISNIICPADTLGVAGGPDASMVCTGSLVVTGAQAQNAMLLNTATVTALDSVGSPLTASSEVTVPLETPAPAMSLVKSGDLDDDSSNGLADVGETIDYSFVLTNTGNVTLTDVSVDDPKAGAVSCSPTELAPGESVTCTADAPYTVTEQDIIDGGVVNAATGYATTPPGVDPIDPPTDSVTTPTPVAAGSLAIAKSGSLDDVNSNGLADVGETIDYSFVLTNTGNVTLTDVSVDDPKAGAVTCNPTMLAPGASVTCTTDDPYVVTEEDVLAGGVINTATGNATTPPGVDPIVPPTDTETTPSAVAGPSMAIVKSASLDDTDGNGLADAGETIDYTFLLVNNGNVTLTDVSIDDPKAGPVTCDPNTLAPGASVTCATDSPYLVTEQDIIDRGVVNTATGHATTPPGVDPIVPPVDTITTPTPVLGAAKSLVKSGSLDDTNGNGLADAGETIDYTFLLTNTGNVTLTNVSVDDPKAGPVTCFLTALMPGESVTCTADNPYTVTEQDIIDGGVVNVATGKATTPPGVDPFVPPTDTETTPTQPARGGLSLVKSDHLNDATGGSDALADAGETIDYTFVLTNTGNVTLTDVGVNDPMVGSVTCTTTTLLPGQSVDCAADTPYTVTTADVAAGKITNSATGGGTTPTGVEPIIVPNDTVETSAGSASAGPAPVPDPAPTAPAAGGSLATTGADVLVMGSIAVLLTLVGAGLFVRRRRTQDAGITP